jgi:hypothetical protein
MHGRICRRACATPQKPPAPARGFCFACAACLRQRLRCGTPRRHPALRAGAKARDHPLSLRSPALNGRAGGCGPRGPLAQKKNRGASTLTGLEAPGLTPPNTVGALGRLAPLSPSRCRSTPPVSAPVSAPPARVSSGRGSARSWRGKGHAVAALRHAPCTPFPCSPPASAAALRALLGLSPRTRGQRAERPCPAVFVRVFASRRSRLWAIPACALALTPCGSPTQPKGCCAPSACLRASPKRQPLDRLGAGGSGPSLRGPAGLAAATATRSRQPHQPGLRPGWPRSLARLCAVARHRRCPQDCAALASLRVRSNRHACARLRLDSGLRFSTPACAARLRCAARSGPCLSLRSPYLGLDCAARRATPDLPFPLAPLSQR